MAGEPSVCFNPFLRFLPGAVTNAHHSLDIMFTKTLKGDTPWVIITTSIVA
jgi:hypothetical protein